MSKTLAELASALTEAQDSYEDARQKASHASHSATSALNRLNDAQKAMDGAIAELRNNAPRDSNWKSSAGERIKIAS